MGNPGTLHARRRDSGFRGFPPWTRGMCGGAILRDSDPRRATPRQPVRVVMMARFMGLPAFGATGGHADAKPACGADTRLGVFVSAREVHPAPISGASIGGAGPAMSKLPSEYPRHEADKPGRAVRLRQRGLYLYPWREEWPPVSCAAGTHRAWGSAWQLAMARIGIPWSARYPFGYQSGIALHCPNCFPVWSPRSEIGLVVPLQCPLTWIALGSLGPKLVMSW